MRMNSGNGTRLAVYFLLFAVPWILFSDLLLASFQSGLAEHRVQTAKGLFFVFFCAGMIKIVSDKLGERFSDTFEKEKMNRRQLNRAEKIGLAGSWQFDFGSQQFTYSDGYRAIFDLTDTNGIALKNLLQKRLEERDLKRVMEA